MWDGAPAALAVRHHIGCLERLSDALRARPDRGERPAALDRTAMEAFLHRLTYLESVGEISADAQIRACREVRAVLVRVSSTYRRLVTSPRPPRSSGRI